MLKIGILGVGAIGRMIATALDAATIGCGARRARGPGPRAGGSSFGRAVAVIRPWCRVEEMIERCELAVEAASQAALPEFVPKALARGRDVLIMSVGGLLGREEWFREAARKRIAGSMFRRARLRGSMESSPRPSGASKSRDLTSRKPMAALAGSKYVVERGLQLDGFKEETVIFEGTAEEAARAFPATSNVAASLRLAVDPAVPVRVRVVAVPGGNENVHEIRVHGEFGKLTMKVENVPSKSNPKTSQLAAFSAVATLKNLTRSLRVGT